MSEEAVETPENEEGKNEKPTITIAERQQPDTANEKGDKPTITIAEREEAD